jgi:imidazole glycerol phosphate synthase subunit HisF
MNADGTKNGIRIELTRLVSEAVNVPGHRFGRRGNSVEHFAEVSKTEKQMPRSRRAFFIFGKSKFRHSKII